MSANTRDYQCSFVCFSGSDLPISTQGSQTRNRNDVMALGPRARPCCRRPTRSSPGRRTPGRAASRRSRNGSVRRWGTTGTRRVASLSTELKSWETKPESQKGRPSNADTLCNGNSAPTAAHHSPAKRSNRRDISRYWSSCPITAPDAWGQRRGHGALSDRSK